MITKDLGLKGKYENNKNSFYAKFFVPYKSPDFHLSLSCLNFSCVCSILVLGEQIWASVQQACFSVHVKSRASPQ